MGYKIILGIFIFSMFIIGTVYLLYPDKQSEVFNEDIPQDYNEDETIEDIPIDMIVDVQELGSCDGPIKCDRTGCQKQC